MNNIRDRSRVCNQHAIINPINIDPVTKRVNIQNAAIWANTLAKTRIPQLFVSIAGLAGHVQQLQNELNRLNIRHLEGCSTDGIDSLIDHVKFVRNSVQKSINAAIKNKFPLPKNLMLEFPLISDHIKI